MRAEDKQLEGPELEREERVREEKPREEEELPAFADESVRDVELEHRSRLFDALRLVIAGETVNLALLYLPQRETRALEALQAAVTGQDSMGEFVFAEDRRSLLEQALAVLQQNVTYGNPEQLAELHGTFDELTGSVAELRERLVSLEDAQDDMIEEKRDWAKAEAGDDAETEAKPTPDDDVSLTGPERKLPAKPASSLDGAPLPEAPPKPSTLEGGAPLPEVERPATTLGDPAELAEAAPKRPWWRKPFG